MLIQHKKFTTRLKESKTHTEMFVDVLKEKHNMVLEEATKEQDIAGVDYFVNKTTPIQFKVRYNHPDFPICLAQPFYGWDDARTVYGRDFNCLCNNKCKQHLLGILSGDTPEALYSCDSEELKDTTKAVVSKWDKTKTIIEDAVYGRHHFTKQTTNEWVLTRRNLLVFEYKGCQIWWKKNFNEKFAKFNLYVPIDSLKTKQKLL